MEVKGQVLIGHELVLLGIGCNLVGVHAHHGYLDGASEVEIVVTQVICGGLELVLGHLSRIVYCLVEDRLGSGNSCLVRDEVEVELVVALNFDKSGVDDGSWAWV